MLVLTETLEMQYFLKMPSATSVYEGGIDRVGKIDNGIVKRGICSLSSTGSSVGAYRPYKLSNAELCTFTTMFPG